ncbi:MAG: MBL fold metallo-hydrolase [Lachnospiraceae bacterium]|nr:MBL fold metallo-hydrolase [Lachnospiraceae bacterium]
MVRVHELHYSNTNTYLIEAKAGNLLFDTGWAGTFPAFCHAVGQTGIPLQKINYILISHFHPDHMGIAGQIAELGPKILVADVQKDFIHSSDSIFEKEGNGSFIPVDDGTVRLFSVEDGWDILNVIGFDGCVIHSPGHSPDSISLFLDEGSLFAGDLNPLYELELHRGTQIEKSWEKLLKLDPKVVYYGHAAKAELKKDTAPQSLGDTAVYALVAQIMKLTDKGCNVQKIKKKTGADEAFIQDVLRMYLTHQNISVQGILDRIEIKNR